MLNELFPKTEQNTENQQQLVENQASFKKWEENISTMRSLIKDSNLFVDNNRGLFDVFNGVQATNEQSHDLINA